MPTSRIKFDTTVWEMMTGVRQRQTADWQVNEINIVVKWSNRLL